MGSSKRYAAHYDRIAREREIEQVMRSGNPASLDTNQLDLEHEPLTRSPTPRQARAWVQYGLSSIEIDVEITAWTDRAVAIKWPAPDGGEHRAWVWTGAVSPRKIRP